MKVSVIVPIYNVEKYLRQCLDSIRNQEFTDFEVLMIDDGSPDNSRDICREYEKEDERFHYFHQENGGLSAARNYGIREAKGEYICFVDSDDMISRRYLQVLYESIEKYHADMVFGYFKKFYDETEIVDDEKKEVSLRLLDQEEAYQKLTVIGEDYKSMNLIVAWNKLIRQDIVKETLFLQGKWHEDEFWIHHIIEKSDKIVETTLEIYYYRQRRDSIVGAGNESDLRHLDIVDAFEDRVRLYKRVASKKTYRKAAFAYRRMIAIHYRARWNTESRKQEQAIKKKLKRRFWRSFWDYPAALNIPQLRYYISFALNIKRRRKRTCKHQL